MKLNLSKLSEIEQIRNLSNNTMRQQNKTILEQKENVFEAYFNDLKALFDSWRGSLMNKTLLLFFSIFFTSCGTTEEPRETYRYGWINKTQNEVIVVFDRGDRKYRIQPNDTNPGLQGGYHNLRLLTPNPVKLEFRGTPTKCLIYEGGWNGWNNAAQDIRYGSAYDDISRHNSLVLAAFTIDSSAHLNRATEEACIE